MGGVVGLLLACALPLEDKTACRTSIDCVDARVCVEGQCRDGACETWCAAVCDAVSDCDEGPASDCEARCVAGDAGEPQLVPTLAPGVCRSLWDEWPEDDACAELACVLACAPICDLAQSCALIVDASACFAGCVAENDICAAAIPSECVAVPDDVQCWEAGHACQ